MEYACAWLPSKDIEKEVTEWVKDSTIYVATMIMQQENYEINLKGNEQSRKLQLTFIGWSIILILTRYKLDFKGICIFFVTFNAISIFQIQSDIFSCFAIISW